MRKNLRKQQQLKRKNFLPTLLITILLWLILGGIVYFINPDTFGVVPLFFTLVFLAFLFTFSLIFVGGRRGLVGAIAITLFLVLAYLGVGNILNLILIVAIATSVELYFTLK